MVNTSKHNTIVKGMILKIRGFRVEVGLELPGTPKPTSLKWMFFCPQPFPINY